MKQGRPRDEPQKWLFRESKVLQIGSSNDKKRLNIS